MKRLESLATAIAVLLLATLARPVLALAEWLLELGAYLEQRPKAFPRAALVVAAALALVTTCHLVLRGTRMPGVDDGRHAVPRRAAPAPPPIRTRWLAHVGTYRVERAPAARSHFAVDLARPAAGIGHTTECSFECALRVFRRHYAPNFLVGRDRLGRIRIVQLVPLGEAAATLRNFPGGVETNAWARAQIELVAHSHRYQWQADPAVMRAFSALLLALRDAAGIPLARPYVDAYTETAASWRRRDGRWGRTPGWFNHGEIPENDHWDMGGFRWRVALAGARRDAALVRASSIDRARAGS
ncbi:MAG TPA: hypothetical protein VGJ77_02920 [Gaiellaceae bacterium]